MILSQPSFIDWLEGKFIDMNEIGGMPITKDNCESMFEGWLENQDREEMEEWADRYGNDMYLTGSKAGLAEAKEIVNRVFKK